MVSSLLPSTSWSVKLTSGPSLYPPTSPVGYRRLLHAIHSSPLDRLKKDCFYYYLLKGGSTQNGEMMEDKDQTERSRRFAESRCLSKTWRVFMDGYWSLDHGLWEVCLFFFPTLSCFFRPPYRSRKTPWKERWKARRELS
jgi:hypothetical protein